MKWLFLAIVVVAIVLLAHGLLYQDQSALVPSGNQFQVYTIKGESVRITIIGSATSTENVSVNGHLYSVSSNSTLLLYMNQTGTTIISPLPDNHGYLLNVTVIPNNTVRWEYIVAGVAFAGIAAVVFRESKK